MSSFVIEQREYTDADVVRLVAEVQQEYVVRYGGPDDQVVNEGDFAPPNGVFLVGRLDGDPVAMGGWRFVDGSIAEIKRMYVAERARRRGLARRLLAELERRATAAGATRLILNTGTEQPEALALYEACGYLPAPPYGHYAEAELARFYGKDLNLGGAGS